MHGVLHKMDIISGTLAKAYGVIGGYIAGSKHLVDTVRSYAPGMILSPHTSLGLDPTGFIFTTSLPPMICAAAIESIRILKQSPELRDQQQAAAKNLKAALRNVGIPFLDSPSHIVPVLVGNAKICKQVCSAPCSVVHLSLQDL
jgi:5-aminolevulinate synthase